MNKCRLAIDSTGEITSLALEYNGKIIQDSIEEKRQNSAVLVPKISELFCTLNININKLKQLSFVEGQVLLLEFE